MYCQDYVAIPIAWNMQLYVACFLDSYILIKSDEVKYVVTDIATYVAGMQVAIHTHLA